MAAYIFQSNGEDEDIDYIMEMESAIEKKKLKPRTEDFLFKVNQALPNFYYCTVCIL